eukprot:gene20713-biopygen6900
MDLFSLQAGSCKNRKNKHKHFILEDFDGDVPHLLITMVAIPYSWSEAQSYYSMASGKDKAEDMVIKQGSYLDVINPDGSDSQQQ